MNQHSMSPSIQGIFLKTFFCLAIFLSTSLSFSSCVSNMAMFSQPALDSANNLKDLAINLMGKATNPFSKNEKAVNELMTAYNKHLELEKGRGEKNGKTVEMWKLLMDPNKNLLGGFIKKWKADGSLQKTFVDNAKREVGENLNKILNLEGKKKKG